MKSENYCYTCEAEVDRCWNSDSGCSGGGHCMDCGGYDFEEQRRQEFEENMEEADKVLAETLKE